jgi:hypothetical protein
MKKPDQRVPAFTVVKRDPEREEVLQYVEEMRIHCDEELKEAEWTRIHWNEEKTSADKNVVRLERTKATLLKLSRMLDVHSIR